MKAVLAIALASWLAVAAQDSAWTSWPAGKIESIFKAATARGRIAGGRRILNTERARSYKVVAVWLTPEVKMAAARLRQMQERLSAEDSRRELENHMRDDQTLFLIDIDPNEGSGVVPPDWGAVLEIPGRPGTVFTGTMLPSTSVSRSFGLVLKRNFDYDRFWVAFSMHAGDGFQLSTSGEVDLVIRLREHEGRLRFRQQSPAS